MPYDPLSPDRPIDCFRTQAANDLHAEDRVCTGSRCSAWRPQLARHGNGSSSYYLYARGATGTPTGLGVCALAPEVPLWRDPWAPKEPDHA